MRHRGDRNGIFQARGSESLLNHVVAGISQAHGQKEPKTQEEIDALTTDEVSMDTSTDNGITSFLDMVSRGVDIMWLQEEEREKERERAESPSGGQSSGAITELANAVGMELPESRVGDDDVEEMEDDLPPVQGIPDVGREGLKGLWRSRHAPESIQANKREVKGTGGTGDNTWKGEGGSGGGDLSAMGMINSRKA